MKKLFFTLFILLISIHIIAQQKQQADELMSPEDLWAMGRLSDIQLSPDAKTLLFGVSYYSKNENSSSRQLYLMDLENDKVRMFTDSLNSYYEGRWSKDGLSVCYLSAESGSMQLWKKSIISGPARQITDIEGGIEGYSYAPDETRLLYLKQVKTDSTVQDKYNDLPKSSGLIITDLMYRHWDHWVKDYTHIFVASAQADGLITQGKDIMEGEHWESPLRPFGGMEQISWSPDARHIYYTSKKKKGRDYTLSTNSDIYKYDTESKQTINISLGMMGFDRTPSPSPDGKWLAWESMERDGYESDQSRLMIMNLETAEIKDYTADFDQDIHGICWHTDSKQLYFISGWHGTEEIYRLVLKNGKIEKITEGIHNYTSVISDSRQLYATRMAMTYPAEIYRVDEKSGEAVQISHVNDAFFDRLKMGEVEKRWIETTDGKQMLTWVIYPPHFDPEKKYPALLYCQGGPQSMVSQFWSFRWNFQMMAANGYIIVAPNRRGVPGFGQEWNEQISGDYGGQNMKDYLSAIDNLSKEPFVDEERLGAVGASYGGFSVFWLAGNHNKRFKAFIAHDGMFNFESQYLETEEMWFPNWDFGGPFWDLDNEVAQKSYAQSPHKFVQNWDTPILVIHGEKDYRVLPTQGMMAFNAAVLRGIPAEFLYFPDENHWVLKPQNGILWQRTFFNWLDKWLKE